MKMSEIGGKAMLAFRAHRDQILGNAGDEGVEEIKESQPATARPHPSPCTELIHANATIGKKKNTDRENQLVDLSKSIISSRKQWRKNGNIPPLPSENILMSSIDSAEDRGSARAVLPTTVAKPPAPPLPSPVSQQQLKARLFEEFFIVGVDTVAIEGMKTTSQVTYLPPERLFQYPGLPENSSWYLTQSKPAAIARNATL